MQKVYLPTPPRPLTCSSYIPLVFASAVGFRHFGPCARGRVEEKFRKLSYKFVNSLFKNGLSQ